MTLLLMLLFSLIRGVILLAVNIVRVVLKGLVLLCTFGFRRKREVVNDTKNL